jgi:hypothetical protein
MIDTGILPSLLLHIQWMILAFQVTLEQKLYHLQTNIPSWNAFERYKELVK